MVYRLETERLRLREWLPEDREPLAAMNADRRVMEFFPHPLSRAESDAFFDRIAAEWAESGRGLYAVERRGDGRLIGLTGLHRATFEASFTPCIEIGWRFVAEVWGAGLCHRSGAGRAARCLRPVGTAAGVLLYGGGEPPFGAGDAAAGDAQPRRIRSSGPARRASPAAACALWRLHGYFRGTIFR